MGTVLFLCVTHPNLGNIHVKRDQTATGLEYVIGSTATPVSEHDAAVLLSMTGPPCCGHELPFGGEIKLFGKAVATNEQAASVPREVSDATPLPKSPPVVVRGHTRRVWAERKPPEEETEEKVGETTTEMTEV